MGEDMSGKVLADAENILVRLVRLAQLASDPRLLDASYRETPAKVTAFDGFSARLFARARPEGHVWTSFVGNIRMLAGGTSIRSRGISWGDGR